MQLFRKILIVIVATKDYLVHLELPDYQDWLGHLVGLLYYLYHIWLIQSCFFVVFIYNIIFISPTIWYAAFLAFLCLIILIVFK